MWSLPNKSCFRFLVQAASGWSCFGWSPEGPNYMHTLPEHPKKLPLIGPLDVKGCPTGCPLTTQLQWVQVCSMMFIYVSSSKTQSMSCARSELRTIRAGRLRWVGFPLTVRRWWMRTFPPPVDETVETPSHTDFLPFGSAGTPSPLSWDLVPHPGGLGGSGCDW